VEIGVEASKDGDADDLAEEIDGDAALSLQIPRVTTR
jgi:hypothetical protein